MKKPNVIVVMPAYYAEKTIEKTFKEIPSGTVTSVILVDDGSTDKTVVIAKKLGITVYQHKYNLGYGGNQKTCYWEALKKNPDVVVMLHPDYQYDGSKIDKLIKPIIEGEYDIMFGSRIQTRGGALAGGMPKLKYFFNRIFTLVANTVLGVNLSEYLSGLRAYSKKTLELIPFQRFSDDFVFDQQFTFSAIAAGLKIGEIPIPTRYHDEQHTLELFSLKALKFIIESWWQIVLYLLYKTGIYKKKIFI
jgi:glycosyltransferase involved in cell wall biosynthesis